MTDPNRFLHETIDKVMQQREEILTAFIAKYGLQPDECEQVYTADGKGGIVWFVRKR